MDNIKPNADTHERVLELAWEPLCSKLCAGVCPRTPSRPSADLEYVKQDYTASLGNTTINTVQVYYMEILHASRAMRDTFEYNAVTHFINNLTSGIKDKVEVNWTKHRNNLSCDRHVQMTLLTKAQIEANKAETKI